MQQHWSQQSTPLLLSSLGAADEGEVSRLVKREYSSLRSFLEQALSERLRVVEHSLQATIVGVVPRNEDTDKIEDWDRLLEGTRSGVVRHRLHPAFWAAFRKPLDEGKERYILFDDGNIGFDDLPLGASSAEGVLIPGERVVGPGATVEETYENAKAWAEENNLDIERFRHSVSVEDSGPLPANDLLGKLIVALEVEDLRKISIPMEVVAKLRRHPS